MGPPFIRALNSERMDERRKPHFDGPGGPGRGNQPAQGTEPEHPVPFPVPVPHDLPSRDEPDALSPAEREWAERALDGDPVGVREACSTCQTELAYLIDPDRHLIWAVSLLAQARPAGSAIEELGGLVKECAEQALFTMISMDEQLYNSGWAPGLDGDPRYDYLMDAFVLEPGQCLASQARFNMLPRSTRLAFFALALLGRSVAECIKDGLGLTKEQLLGWVEVAMRTLTEPQEDSDG